MKKIIIGIVVILLIVGAFILVLDQKTRKELSRIEESKEVNSNNPDLTQKKVVDSENTITRVNGVWSVESTDKFGIDPNSLKFEFTGYKPGGQHIGTFNNMKVDIAFDAQGFPIGSVMSMDVDSIKTDSEKLDIHLKGSDFFDKDNFPLVSVIVKSIEKNNGTSTNAITEISMLGVSKTLSIPVTLEQLYGKTKFSVDTRINVSDFGMAYGPVLNEVRIVVEGIVNRNDAGTI